ncbi:MAG: hypothetical protein GC131_03710 [Alphaproteobacteria bacterium]|nr:hypothetical protein [Alphaproteobacteria bacterium]
MTLCALVRDAMQVETDALPLLQRVADELALAGMDNLPEEIAADPRKMEALASAGFVKKAA